MRMFRGLVAVVAAAGLALAAVPAAAMSQEEVKATIAERYEVEVLKVEPGTLDGQRVWMVTVMEPGGTSNAAFRVARLAVDRESGELVPAFRHDRSGYDLPPGGGRFTRDITRPNRAAGTVWR
jgi:hypothetical protein